jgi:hypothetical protein
VFLQDLICGPRIAAGIMDGREGEVMAGEIVASNALLKDRATNLRTLFDSGHSLRLYKNDLHPKPEISSATYVEASFDGYARINMAGKWRAVAKGQDGMFHFSSLDCQFTATGTEAEVIHGWMLFGPLGVVLACRLPFPVSMVIPKVLTVRCDVLVWDAATLKP